MMINTSARSRSVLSIYNEHIKRKWLIFFSLMFMIFILVIYAITQGAYELSPIHVINSLIGQTSQNSADIVIWNIRMPRIIASIVAGWGLAVSGLAIQTLLKNPLGSPFTLGISQGAAFGAAFAIVIFGSDGIQTANDNVGILNIFSVTFFAFLGSMAATFIILALSRIRKMSAEGIILAGVALSSLFTSGTILIQFFATETELASVVFWTFGDVARSGWKEIGITAAATFFGTIYLVFNRWNLNALASGEEVAKGLGVEVEKIRIMGMLVSSLMAALVTAFHGVIAFLGLLAPHIARRLVGGDNSMLIPFSSIIGAFLLLLADTTGRVVVGSGSLPVGVLTSFMGAPLFLYLLIRGNRR